MGLLDALNNWGKWTGDEEKDAAIGQGILQAGLALLGNQGNTAQALSQAGLAGLQGFASAKESQYQQAQRKMQSEQQQAEAERKRKIVDLAQAFQPGTASNAMQDGGGPSIANAKKMQAGNGGAFDYQGYANALAGVDPTMALQIKGSLAKESPFGKVDPKDFTPESVAKFAQTGSYGDLMPRSKREVAPSGQVYDPYAVQPGTAFNDPNKAFGVDANGNPISNAAVQRYETGLKLAGRPQTNVNVNTTKPLLNTIAEGVAQSAISDFGAAKSAASTVQSAQNLRALLNSGKVATGPTANLELFARQIGASLGIEGKDNKEVLANTRQTIQGLAQFELEAAQAMKGQGALTDAERQILRRAAAGEITFTKAELTATANALEGRARKRIMQQQTNAQILGAFPEAAPLMPFLQVQQPPNQSANAEPSSVNPFAEAAAAELARRQGRK